MAALLMFVALLGGGTTPSFGDLLARVGKSVEVFWEQFSAVSCNENVSQTKLGNTNKVLFNRDSVYDYLISMSIDGDDIAVEESRLLQKSAKARADVPLLVSNGFPTLLLIFHPYYQGGFEYTRLDDEVVDGRIMLRIQFRHISGGRSTSALRLRGRDYPLDLQGTAWIDQESMAVVRIKSGLMAPMNDVGLKALETDVRYAPFKFPPGTETEWLPTVAIVDLETPRQHWRNTHRFSDYKHFSVKSDSKIQK
jgi:hypothetical protein